MGLVRALFRKSFDHVERYAGDWTAANERALASDGPLWVVLGDSAAQGVGASAYDQGWVGLVLARLRADGTPWRVVNLSRSGARTREVLERQWPRGRDLDAALVTAVVGGNDARLTRREQWLRDASDLIDALPPGAVVSTTARGLFERKTAVVNDRIRASAAARGLRVADVWSHTGPPYKGLYFDGLHPNDRGYAQWADAVWAALRSSPQVLRAARVAGMPLTGEYEPSTQEWVRDQVELIESSGGTQGTEMRGMPVIVVTNRGAKSGKLRKTPLMRVEHEGRYALVASQGGAPEHPSWHFNLLADPRVELQDGPTKQDMTARELTGDERSEWWRRAVEAFAPYREYQFKTKRQIPVWVLEPSATHD